MFAAMFHADFSDQNHMIHFMKNVSIVGGFLFLIVHGAGSYLMDNWEKAEANSCPITIVGQASPLLKKP
jgi:putative oxidoreductase